MAVSYALFGVSRVSAKLPALLGSLAIHRHDVAAGARSRRAARGLVRGAAGGGAADLRPGARPEAVGAVHRGDRWSDRWRSLCAVRLGWPREASATRWWASAAACAAASPSGCTRWRSGTSSRRPACVLARVRGRRLVRVRRSAWLGFVRRLAAVLDIPAADAVVDVPLRARRQPAPDRRPLDVLPAWWSDDLPRGVGLWHPWGPSPPDSAGVMAAGDRRGRLVWAIVGRRARGCGRWMESCYCWWRSRRCWCFSGFGGPVLNEYGFDATGRYTPPIWNALAVVLGAALAAVWSCAAGWPAAAGRGAARGQPGWRGPRSIRCRRSSRRTGPSCRWTTGRC